MAPQMMAPVVPSPEAKARYEAHQKKMQAMQKQQRAKMDAARKAYEERMKQWSSQAPKAPVAPAAK